MTDPIAICALSCRYPDAHSPDQFWRNLMHGRRSFRPLPASRIPLAQYHSRVAGAADSIEQVLAAQVTNWHFDRDRFRVPKKTFENTDMTHWLSLSLAAEAIDTVERHATLAKDRTAVVIANTLTGEFSRSALLRLRHPFLDEILEAALESCGTGADAGQRIRESFAAALKGAFPEPNEDSLAGGLANTIAGRIANYFDYNGGAYSVDGACSSSLIAVANGASMLAAGEVDTVIAGAVDISLDPFELVGFSRNGALSKSRMRVFDHRADGFWPGEGGAVAVMMREADAQAQNIPILARLRGWAMSTDGAGGLTRPDEEGQWLACQRAHEKAGIDPADVDFVEAHGTGTAVGDPTEVRALARMHAGRAAPLPIGSVKGNIGHTKAAAGFAGLTKAIGALHFGQVPPHVACEQPSPVFAEVDGSVTPMLAPLGLDVDAPHIAGVSSFGFGGINVHVLLEAAPRRRAAQTARAAVPVGLNTAEQGAEIFAFAAATEDGLHRQLAELIPYAGAISIAEMADLAAHLAGEIDDRAVSAPCRLAFTAARGDDLAAMIADACRWLKDGHPAEAQPAGIHASLGRPARGICLLFSGQAAPVRAPSPVWHRRFPFLRDLSAGLPDAIIPGDPDTANAQPAITLANLTGLAALQAMGIRGDTAIGHSLGEISALAWAGVITPDTALGLAATRGRIMADHGARDGAMARIDASAADCRALLAGTDCEIACQNGLRDTVISGPASALDAARARAAQAAIGFHQLKTSHGFHSRGMAPAQRPFAAALRSISFEPATRDHISTISMADTAEGVDPAALLERQLVDPVLFLDALETLDPAAWLMIECGPGGGLIRLAEAAGFNGFAIDALAPDLGALMEAGAAAFAAGQALDFDLLYGDRGIYPIDDLTPPDLFSNACGSSRDGAGPQRPVPPAQNAPEPSAPANAAPVADDAIATGDDGLGRVLAAVADEIGLDADGIDPDAGFQTDLHMNSLAVTRVVVAAAKAMGVRPLANPTDFADASPRILADALGELHAHGDAAAAATRIVGLRPWFAAYGTRWRQVDSPVAAAPLRNGNGAVPRAQSTRVLVPRTFDQDAAIDLVTTLQAHAKRGLRHVEILHQGAPVSAFLRSVFLEDAFAGVTVIDRGRAPETDLRIDMLANAADGYREFRLCDDAHTIEEPVFARQAPQTRAVRALDGTDVILAIGCHRGIGAECALAMATGGARVVFTGRSGADDPDVAKILKLARERGVAAAYLRCDVTDPQSVAAIAEDAAFKGQCPTALLYAPALNEPERFADLGTDMLRDTLAPKCAGLEAVLDHFGDGLVRLVAFGSIIGRIGLQGESHYALANALQSQIVAAFGADHPACACLSIEWTVWSGAGMGERLGTIERLLALGVDAIPFDQALAQFRGLIDDGASGTVCVTGRFGAPAGLELGRAAIPPLRFADEILIHYPGTEVVTEAEINTGRDAYLRDHAVDGHEIFPGVMGMEAMAQAVSVLTGNAPVAALSDIRFHRAITVPRDGTRIRVAAQTTDAGQAAAVFCADDGYAEPCFTAEFNGPDRGARPPIDPPPITGALPTDLAPFYGPLFFHGPQFARLSHALAVSSRRVDVTLTPQKDGHWFGQYEPQTLILGDAALADAALHMLQLTILHRRVLPVSIGWIRFSGRLDQATQLSGRENWARDGLYSFDIVARDAQGQVLCHWGDAHFRAISGIDADPIIQTAPILSETLLERLARETLDDAVRLALVRDDSLDRAARRQAVLDRLDLGGKVTERADGLPLVADGTAHIGLSHAAKSTIAILSDRQVSCDLVDLGCDIPDKLSEARWSEGEVLRKLGYPDPFGFSAGQASGQKPEVDISSTVIAPIGLCAAFGMRRPAPQT